MEVTETEEALVPAASKQQVLAAARVLAAAQRVLVECLQQQYCAAARVLAAAASVCVSPAR